jgi:ketosteroid isomerase-like protein
MALDEAHNDALIERLYKALDAGDADAAAGCYAPNATFSDPVFTDLHGDEVGGMWQMLTSRAGDMRIELLGHAAGPTAGSARWRARYTFSQTGRPVVNEVDATLEFSDGLIIHHRDDFDFHKWARQALGPIGLLLGWTPLVRAGVRSKARRSLDAYLAEHPAT